MISQTEAVQLEWGRLVHRLKELCSITRTPVPSLPDVPTEQDFRSIRIRINQLEQQALSK